MGETGIGYRGFKSIVLPFINTIVKKQRVDGSWQDVTSHPCLRCILTGFKKNCPLGLFSIQNIENHQIRILFNRINKQIRLYNTTKEVQQCFTEKQNLLCNKLDP